MSRQMCADAPPLRGRKAAGYPFFRLVRAPAYRHYLLVAFPDQPVSAFCRIFRSFLDAWCRMIYL